MKPSYHVVVSAGISLGWLYFLKSWPSALICFLSGILIDIDHYYDYYVARKKIPWRYREMWDFARYDASGKIYLLFHSYELIIPLWGLIYFLNLGIVWAGFMWGITTHVMCDQMFNPLKPFGYFFFYRKYHGFERKNLFRKECYEQWYG